MARYSATVRTGAGSTTLPIISLYAIAAISPSLRQVEVFNTSAVAVALQLVRLTTAGTQGAGLTESKHNDRSPNASCTAFTTHTVAPTVTDILFSWALGAAVGSAIIDTFGDLGILVPAGTGNGIGVIVATGTGQVCDATLVWDE